MRIQQYAVRYFQGWLKLTIKMKACVTFIFRCGFPKIQSVVEPPKQALK